MYATSAYILYYIKHKDPECNVKVIPGVTSFNAASASAQLPLSLQNEPLLVLPTPDEPEKLYKLLDEVILYNKVLILLKLGCRWLWVREILKEKDLMAETLFAQRVGFDDEMMIKAEDVKLEKASYFSLLIIRKSPDYIFS